MIECTKEAGGPNDGKSGYADLGFAPGGFVGAFDNNHMIVAFWGKGISGRVPAKQTRDGGKTWEDVAFPQIDYMDHQSSRGWCFDANGDCAFISNRGFRCCGGYVPLPHPRIFFIKATFTGDGWEGRDCHDLKTGRMIGFISAEQRHCGSRQETVARLANGRLWTAYGDYPNRTLRPITNVCVKYSDDDGVTWRSWREGKTGAIARSESLTLHPWVVPYRDQVAVIWQDHERGGVLWSRYDGQGWSKPEEVAPSPARFGGGDSHAVTVGKEDIFVAAGGAYGGFSGILHWNGTKWEKELPEMPPGALLAVAGRTLMLFTWEQKEKGTQDSGIRIVAHKRTADGKWEGPNVLAEEDTPLTTYATAASPAPGLVAQLYAPPNFVPVAWSCKRQTVLKVLRVPVDW